MESTVVSIAIIVIVSFISSSLKHPKQVFFLTLSIQIIFTTRSQRPIVSCSDNSWFSSVNAFTVEDTHEFHLQMVLMSLSYIHYGNPASPIDYVIAHWREGEVKGKRIESVMPEACFIGYQRKYRKDWLDEDHLQKTVHKMNGN